MYRTKKVFNAKTLNQVKDSLAYPHLTFSQRSDKREFVKLSQTALEKNYPKYSRIKKDTVIHMRALYILNS